MYKNISVLGSTGSIGRQTLEVCGELGIKLLLLPVAKISICFYLRLPLFIR